MSTDFDQFSNAFAYNTITGHLHRKGSPTPITGKQVRHNGTDYWVNRIVWLLNTGSWPTGNLKFVDGNKKNTRINNLRLASSEASPLDAPHLELAPPSTESSELVSLKARFIAEDSRIQHYTEQLEAKYGLDWEDTLAVKSLSASAAMGQLLMSREELRSKIEQLEGNAPAPCSYAGYGHFKFPCIDNECRTVDEWLKFYRSCPYTKLIPNYDREIEGFKLFVYGMYLPQDIEPLVREVYEANVLARTTTQTASVQIAKMRLQLEESLRNPYPEIVWLESQIWASKLPEHRARPADYLKHSPPLPVSPEPMSNEQVLNLQSVDDFINDMLSNP